jgi:hypothetical protein
MNFAACANCINSWSVIFCRRVRRTSTTREDPALPWGSSECVMFRTVKQLSRNRRKAAVFSKIWTKRYTLAKISAAIRSPHSLRSHHPLLEGLMLELPDFMYASHFTIRETDLRSLWCRTGRNLRCFGIGHFLRTLTNRLHRASVQTAR